MKKKYIFYNPILKRDAKIRVDSFEEAMELYMFLYEVDRDTALNHYMFAL